MSALTQAAKDKLFDRVKQRIARWYGTSATEGKSCLYWMHAGLVTLDQAGIQCMPACGSAKWEMAPDTGSNSTHFGFEWEGGIDGRRVANLTTGKTGLPEMHCWIWLTQDREIVDFSTQHIPKLAAELGFVWEVTPPPPYIWARPQSLFPRAVYWPNRDATQLAIATLVADRKGIQ